MGTKSDEFEEREERELSLLVLEAVSSTVTLTRTWYSTPTWGNVRLPEVESDEKFYRASGNKLTSD